MMCLFLFCIYIYIYIYIYMACLFVFVGLVPWIGPGVAAIASTAPSHRMAKPQGPSLSVVKRNIRRPHLQEAERWNFGLPS